MGLTLKNSDGKKISNIGRYGPFCVFTEFTRGKYRKVSREAPLKLLKSREGMKMKLVSGGDGVISRCEEVEISAVSATLGWFFGHIISKCHRMDPYYGASESPCQNPKDF